MGKNYQTDVNLGSQKTGARSLWTVPWRRRPLAAGGAQVEQWLWVRGDQAQGTLSLECAGSRCAACRAHTHWRLCRPGTGAHSLVCAACHVNLPILTHWRLNRPTVQRAAVHTYVTGKEGRIASANQQLAEPQHRSDIEGIPETAATALNGVTTVTIRMCRRCWNVIPAKIFYWTQECSIVLL